ncbi:MAG: hypothetical protein NXI32_11300 [bacterium]|nr:hypothetical protein [bacterium]
MTRNHNQYVLPFDAAKGELLAQVNLLRHAETELTPVRTDKVVELLERLILLGNDLTERDGLVRVRAQVIALAARIDRRSTVSDRSIRTWRAWAEQIGVIATDFRSQRLGRREWNVFIIDVARIRALVRPTCRVGLSPEVRPACRAGSSPSAALDTDTDLSSLSPLSARRSSASEVAGSGRKFLPPLGRKFLPPLGRKFLPP